MMQITESKDRKQNPHKYVDTYMESTAANDCVNNDTTINNLDVDNNSNNTTIADSCAIVAPDD